MYNKAVILNKGNFCDMAAILRGDYQMTIQPTFGLIVLSGILDNLNVIFVDQNIQNCDYGYKSADRKIRMRNPEYMFNYSLSYSCIFNLSSFWLAIYIFIVTGANLFQHNFWEGSPELKKKTLFS